MKHQSSVDPSVRASGPIRAAGLVLGLLAAGAAQAQFAMVPAPLCVAPHQSATADEEQYRIDAARHLYTCFPMRVFRGRVPPLLYGVMVVDIAIGADGAVSGVDVIRKPAAEEVEPWVVAMIRRAAPFPAPAKLPGGTVHFTETFVVDKSGLFQVMSLAEGQRDH